MKKVFFKTESEFNFWRNTSGASCEYYEAKPKPAYIVTGKQIGRAHV